MGPFQSVTEEPVFTMRRCIVDDVSVGVWELIFYPPTCVCHLCEG